MESTFLHTDLELEHRRELREIQLADGTVHSVPVTQCPPRWADGASRQMHGRKRNLLRQ